MIFYIFCFCVFQEFDIPMMDEESLAENADMIVPNKASHSSKPSVPLSQFAHAHKASVEHRLDANKPSESVAATIPPPPQQVKPEKSGMELLKEMYAKDEEHKNTKIKLKLRVGTVVDIYSSSRQDWVEVF